MGFSYGFWFQIQAFKTVPEFLRGFQNHETET